DATGQLGAPTGSLDETTGGTQIIGAWTAGNGQITFAPSAVPDSVTQVSKSYVIVHGGVASLPGTVTISFQPATAPPVASDISKITADRVSPFEFPVNGAALQGPLTGPTGAWTADKTKVTFTPATLGPGQVTVTIPYILVKGTAQSAKANLSLTYLPAPAPISKLDVSRTAGFSAD